MTYTATILHYRVQSYKYSYLIIYYKLHSTLYFTTLHYTIYFLYHTIHVHTIPYHTMPCHTIPYHTIPYHTIPYHIPYYTILYHTTGLGEHFELSIPTKKTLVKHGARKLFFNYRQKFSGNAHRSFQSVNSRQCLQRAVHFILTWAVHLF